MKRVSLLFSVLVAIALLAAPLAPAWAGEGKKHHELTVTVVSVDENGKMMTFKTDTGEQKSAPVIGKAIDQLKGLKAGETVTLTCTDKDNGDHEGISDIKVPAAKK